MSASNSKRRATWRLAALIALVICTGLPAQARLRRKPSIPPVLPSPIVEERVNDSFVEAARTLGHLDVSTLLDNPHLVTAMYYHDGYLERFPVDKPDADPSGRVSAKIIASMSAGDKTRFVELLRQAYGDAVAELPDAPAVTPVPVRPDNAQTRRARRRHRRYNHRDALDLFVPEGHPVRSFSRGVVILADSGWMPGDPFSAVSDRGGNSVVVFDPTNNRFYRYCHLGSVAVETGSLVIRGQTIGQVGHSGRNAAMPGHGGHLHFEANQFREGRMTSLDEKELKAMLREFGPSSPG